MCYLDLCIQLFFSPKNNVKSLSEQNFKRIIIKNVKMKPPITLFKKKGKKLCSFVIKSQKSKPYQQFYVVCIRRKMKRKMFREKQAREELFKNNLFYLLFEFQELYQPQLGYAFLLSLICFLFMLCQRQSLGSVS